MIALGSSVSPIAIQLFPVKSVIFPHSLQICLRFRRVHPQLLTVITVTILQASKFHDNPAQFLAHSLRSQTPTALDKGAWQNRLNQLHCFAYWYHWLCWLFEKALRKIALAWEVLA